MKVIDLLNKMANDKNYRPTVKFFTSTYKYNEEKMEKYFKYKPTSKCLIAKILEKI